jgi:E3 ubiquitin-protein ligase makorin
MRLSFAAASCDHAFCLACIRKWRNEASKDAVVRCCPLCRTLSYVIVPSRFWPKSPEEKAQIFEGYKSSLRCVGANH